MPCNQCGKPALFKMDVEGGPLYLCLDCKLKVFHMEQAELDRHERALNYLADEFDAISGIPLGGGRFPPRKVSVINAGGITLNNIKVSNSTVGVLNTGTIQSVDQAVTSLNQSGEKNASAAIQLLTNMVIADGKLTAQQKNEILELISMVAGEATVPKERRRSAAIGPLIDRLASLVTVMHDGAALWAKVAPFIAIAFGISTPST